jgi:ribose transport system permease protein
MTTKSPENETLSQAHTRDTILSSGLRGLRTIGPLPILILIAVVIFAWGNPRFLGEANLTNISQQAVYLLIVALAQMLVLIAGGFDLSVGSNLALTSVTSSLAMVAVLTAYPDMEWLAVAAGLGATLCVGIFCGACNAFGVGILKVNPFIATLATTSIFQGITLIVSQGVQVGGLPQTFIYTLGSGFVGSVPIAALIALPIAIAVYVLMSWTRFGRKLYATGSNPRAALIAGISVKTTLAITYLLCTVLTSVSGFLLTARIASGEPLLGGEFPLRSITAAVIGGCSLRGGQGTVGGVVMGVLFVTILSNGMDLLRLGSNVQMVILGIVLIFAVVADRYRSN